MRKIALIAASVLVAACGGKVDRNEKCTGEPVYKHILLRDFRTVKDGQVINYNIGTAAHGPATLNVLRKYLPEDVEITVWADKPLEACLEKMMTRRFPDVEIVTGDLSSPSGQLQAAVERSDLFLVSSGNGIAVAKSLKDYKQLTGKASAAYAIGYSSSQDMLLKDMDFAWFRDEISAKNAAEKETTPSITGWAPDAVFDFDCIDEKGASDFLKANGLKAGKFICCLPGFRHTPNWEYYDVPVNEKNLADNEAHQDADNAILRRIITETVRDRGLKVLVCAEQIPELRLCKEEVYDKLPEDVRSKCVFQKEWWAPDLALGIYCKSLCLCGIEMHSMVMAIGNGVPAAVFRHSGFGNKSDMWNTIGLGDWLLDIDSEGAPDKASAMISSILDDRAAALAKVAAAREAIDSASRNAVQVSFMKQ